MALWSFGIGTLLFCLGGGLDALLERLFGTVGLSQEKKHVLSAIASVIVVQVVLFGYVVYAWHDTLSEGIRRSGTDAKQVEGSFAGVATPRARSEKKQS